MLRSQYRPSRKLPTGPSIPRSLWLFIKVKFSILRRLVLLLEGGRALMGRQTQFPDRRFLAENVNLYTIGRARMTTEQQQYEWWGRHYRNLHLSRGAQPIRIFLHSKNPKPSTCHGERPFTRIAHFNMCTAELLHHGRFIRNALKSSVEDVAICT
jgi:hypothetical protein